MRSRNAADASPAASDPGSADPADPAGPAAGSGSRVQRRRLRHRDRILNAAEERFASMLYTAVRIEDIADAADVSVGTLYTHFDTKDGLFLAVAERALDLADSYVAQACAGLTTPTDRLVARGQAYLDLLIDNPSLTRFLVSPTTIPASPAIQTSIRGRIEGLYDDLAGEITSGIDAGEIQPVDARALAVFLIGAWSGVLAVAANPATPDLDGTAARHAITQAAGVLLNGLATSRS